MLYVPANGHRPRHEPLDGAALVDWDGGIITDGGRRRSDNVRQ
jgi:hypothetical protein